jgi:hypothetical protein
MKKFIFISIFIFSQHLYAVCCCDDDQNILGEERRAISDLKDNLSDIKEAVKNRSSYYDESFKNNDAILLFESRAFSSASRLRDAISMKENFEGLVAGTALDGARLDSGISAALLRGKVGNEAKDIISKIRK